MKGLFFRAAGCFFVILLFSAWLDPFKDRLNAGNDALEQGRFDEAMRCYEEAWGHAETGQQKDRVNYNRGVLYSAMGDHEKAIDLFKASSGSDDPEIRKKSLYNLGVLKMKEGDKREAADAFARAMDGDPSYMKAKKNMEYLLKKREQEKSKNSRNSKDGQGSEAESRARKQYQGREGNRQKKSSGDPSGQRKISRDQARAIMEAMRDKPVRRNKGGKDGTALPEKYW